ncbi:MAG: replication initiation factor domain-containing protein [Leptospiraceae bacterium]|nr:replication initiation factor domain-containing protein [Leptospiraceae bacterium]
MPIKNKSLDIDRSQLYSSIDNRYFSESVYVDYNTGEITETKSCFYRFSDSPNYSDLNIYRGQDIKKERKLKVEHIDTETQDHKLSLFIDWLNFKVKNTIPNRNKLFELLPPLEESILKKGNTKVMSYTHKDRIIKLEYHFEEIEEIICKISSRGLSLIFNETENYKPSMTIEELIEWIFKNDKLKRTKKHGTIHSGITRIDFALDDFAGFADMDYLQHKADTNCYVTRLGECTPYAPKDLQRRKIKGKTLYFGDRASPTFIRFYDKLAKCKDGKTEVDPLFQTWNRMEIELKSNMANVFTHSYLTNPKFVPYHWILGILRFTTKPVKQDDKNKQRFEVDYFFAKFLKGTEKPERLRVPQLVYDLENLDRYVEKNCLSPVDTYVRIHGMKKLVDVLEERKEATNKKPKYSSLIEIHGENFEYDEMYENVLSDAKASKLNRKKKKDEDNE